MLDEKVSERVLYSRLPNVDREFTPPFCALVVTTGSNPNIIPAVRIRELMEKAASGASTIIYNGQVVGLMTGKCRIDMAALDKLCKKWKLLCGVSNPFSNFLQLAAYYRQALKAVELGADSASGLHIYERLYMRHVSNVFSKEVAADVFCCPALKTLFKYDQDKGKDLSLTLYEYLKNERNAVLTAKQMKIHRNTLIQRLNRVGELIITDDLDDPEVRMYIMLSYEMMKALKPGWSAPEGSRPASMVLLTPPVG